MASLRWPQQATHVQPATSASLVKSVCSPVALTTRTQMMTQILPLLVLRIVPATPRSLLRALQVHLTVYRLPALLARVAMPALACTRWTHDAIASRSCTISVSTRARCSPTPMQTAAGFLWQTTRTTVDRSISALENLLSGIRTQEAVSRAGTKSPCLLEPSLLGGLTSFS